MSRYTVSTPQDRNELIESKRVENKKFKLYRVTDHKGRVTWIIKHGEKRLHSDLSEEAAKKIFDVLEDEAP